MRQVLSPVVNVARDARWGRVEETYGEDPCLTSLFGQAFVAAFERAGIVATPKHFVANVGEGGREGLLHETDVARLAGMHARLRALFRDDLVRGAAAAWHATGERTAVAELDLGRTVTARIADLREEIEHGQAVARYTGG